MRNVKLPISSQVDATAARLAGDWVVRVAWPGAARHTGERIRLQATGGGLWLDGKALSPKGAGRFGAARRPQWWVLWLDAGNRTAAIGTPRGEFGWIMDRRPAGGEDRIRAAKEIMQWMGYDMARAME